MQFKKDIRYFIYYCTEWKGNPIISINIYLIDKIGNVIHYYVLFQSYLYAKSYIDLLMVGIVFQISSNLIYLNLGYLDNLDFIIRFFMISFLFFQSYKC